MNGSRRVLNEITSGREPDGKLISINEYQLWRDFKSGDLAAYAMIYRKYFFILYNYGKKISNDGELIKDCIQDLFIKIWNNRENLNDTTSVKYYLLTSLKRKLLDTLKSPGHRLRAETEAMYFEITDTDDNDEESFHWQKEKVLNAITKLSKHQQRVLQMKFYGNQSNQEIAKELGITIQSVYNSVFKTLRALRKRLQIILWLAMLNLWQ
jgi:RNA polymerase sigma factor (sigma-70 family)